MKHFTNLTLVAIAAFGLAACEDFPSSERILAGYTSSLPEVGYFVVQYSEEALEEGREHDY